MDAIMRFLVPKIMFSIKSWKTHSKFKCFWPLIKKKMIFTFKWSNTLILFRARKQNLSVLIHPNVQPIR